MKHIKIHKHVRNFEVLFLIYAFSHGYLVLNTINIIYDLSALAIVPFALLLIIITIKQGHTDFKKSLNTREDKYLFRFYILLIFLHFISSLIILNPREERGLFSNDYTVTSSTYGAVALTTALFIVILIYSKYIFKQNEKK